MTSHPIIAVIGSLSTDQIVTTHHLPDSGETLHASGLHVRCGGKGANTSVEAYRLSHKNPRSPDDSRVTNGVLDNDIQVRLKGTVYHSSRTWNKTA